MRPFWIRFRLVLMLAAIFALGALAGHLVTQRWLSSASQLEASTEAAVPEEEEGEDRRRLIRATRKVMDQYRDTLGLDDEQMERVKPIFVSASIEMSTLSKSAPQRLSIIEKVHKQMKPVLNPHQRQLCEEILAQARQNHSGSSPAGAP